MVSHAKFSEYNRGIWLTLSVSYFCTGLEHCQILFTAHKSLHLNKDEIAVLKLNASFQTEAVSVGDSDHQLLVHLFIVYFLLAFIPCVPSLQGCLILRRPSFLPLTVLLLLIWNYFLW